MLQKLKDLFPQQPSRAELEASITLRDNTIAAIIENRRALLAEAHFRDKAGRMLPKGEVLKHLRGLTDISSLGL